MESREIVIKALQDGKTLVSNVTGLYYILKEGRLYMREREQQEWNPSGLTFENPQSWLNLREVH